MNSRTRTRPIQERAFEFACDVIVFAEKVGTRPGIARLLTRQLVRSGTSVGANLEEANGAQSKADFVSKCSIAVKEAREAKYWLRLLAVSKSTLSENLDPLIDEIDEIVAILTTIVKKAGRSPHRGEINEA